MRSSSTSALATDAVQIADKQNAQQQLGIDRRSPNLAEALFQLLLHKLETDVRIDQPQQVIFRNLVLQAKVVEQRFRTGALPPHDQQASNGQHPAQPAAVLTRFP